MKIYTKTGDEGETGLWGGQRRSKDHVRIEACGAVDELNAGLGAARAECLPPEVDAVLDRVQRELFVLGAELASSSQAAWQIGESRVAALERDLDAFTAQLPPLHNFILPGGVRGGAELHVARTVCRRAERRVVQLAAAPGEQVSQTVLCYLNRLGDLLFVLARCTNASAGRQDVVWRAAQDSHANGGGQA